MDLSLPTCPVCRAECTAPARRCFIEAECPVCLTATSIPYVLSCGHTICFNDCTQLKIPVEEPGKPRRLAKIRARAKILASKCAPLMVLAFAVVDPGAPAQWLYMVAGMLSGRFDSLCNDPCYARSEADNHVCQHDCDCDGARTCSFFEFCVGHSGECTAAASATQKAWQLQASMPDSSGVYPDSSGVYHIKINSSSAFNASWLDLPAASPEREGSLSFQLLVWDTSVGGQALMRVRGPAGHYGRIEVRCDGHTHQQPHATPLAGRGDDDWSVSSDGGVRFKAPTELVACATGVTRDGCNDFSLDLVFSELRYVPTFSMSGGVELVAPPRGSSRWTPLRLAAPSSFIVAPDLLWSSMVFRAPGSSVTAPFEIAGTGRFALRVYPAGTHGAPPGRCSVLLTGPHGVKLLFVLRVRHKLFGTLGSPLSCADAGAGCWLKDAGPAASHSKRGTTGIVAVSFVTVEHSMAGPYDLGNTSWAGDRILAWAAEKKGLESGL